MKEPADSNFGSPLWFYFPLGAPINKDGGLSFGSGGYQLFGAGGQPKEQSFEQKCIASLSAERECSTASEVMGSVRALSNYPITNWRSIL